MRELHIAGRRIADDTDPWVIAVLSAWTTARFGKALRCPDCNGGRPSRSS